MHYSSVFKNLDELSVEEVELCGSNWHGGVNCTHVVVSGESGESVVRASKVSSEVLNEVSGQQGKGGSVGQKVCRTGGNASVEEGTSCGSSGNKFEECSVDDGGQKSNVGDSKKVGVSIAE